MSTNTDNTRWWTDSTIEELKNHICHCTVTCDCDTRGAAILTALTPHVRAYVDRCGLPTLLQVHADGRTAARAEAFEEAKRIVSGLYKNPKRYESQYDEGFDCAIDLAEQALDRASTTTPEAT